MAIKKFKPTSNATRNMSVLDFAEITNDTPQRTLVSSMSKSAGRNNKGRITTRHKGGGHKRKYRVIEFKRNKDSIHESVDTIKYDINLTENFELINYEDGKKCYILAPKGLKVGQFIKSGTQADIKLGNA